MLLLSVFTAYLAIGYLCHLVLFPENKPPVSSYFKTGQQLHCKKEGIRLNIVKQENGFVYCTSFLEPWAEGPPIHIHKDFEETFAVLNGELSVWLNGEVIKLAPGDSLLVPKGAAHKPFNETNETIHVKGVTAFPEKFAYYLSQVYGVMDHKPWFGKMPATMLQMSLLSSEGFDSYLREGPPVAIQRITNFVLVPLTRLLGYKSYYPEYDINLDRSSCFQEINPKDWSSTG